MPGTGQPLRVLVVDDDQDDFILLRALLEDLESFPCTLEWVPTFDAALSAMVEARHDAYLVDYRLGERDGIELLQAAIARGVAAPVILLTGRGAPDVDAAALRAGAADFLVKGEFDAVQLARTLRYTIGRALDQAELARSEQRYRELFDRVPTPMWLYDREALTISTVNDAALRQYGYTREEFLALSVTDLRPESERARFLAINLTAPSDRLDAGLWRHMRKDGSIFDVHITSHTLDLDGREQRLVLATDVSARVAAERRLRLMDRAMESTTSGILIVDALAPGQPILYANPAFERITEYDATEVQGRNCRFLQGRDTNQPPLEQLRTALRERESVEVELRNYTKGGRLFLNRLNVAPVRDEHGQVTHFVGAIEDVTERRRHEAELARAATHDSVTGLMHYVLLQSELNKLLVGSRAAEGIALLYIDLDRFQAVNETLGHVVGDRALKVVAERIVAEVGSQGTVCRLAGDEFLVAVPGTRARVDAISLANGVRFALEPPIPVGSYSLFLTCSIGISRFPDHGRQPNELLYAAEAAMKRAKESGRNSIHVADLQQVAALRDRLDLGGRLRQAIQDGEMVLHYQPQVHAATGQVIGLEALVRWQTPDLGLLLPGRFIRTAEQLGLIVDLGRWVLEDACRQVRTWLDQGISEFTVAVNVSALQLQRASFVDEVASALSRWNVAPERLELELTESTIMENIGRMTGTMRALKHLGVSLALDDFGTGYSSLNHLKRFPLDKLKIDQSFVREVTHQSGDAAITRAIIAMGHQLRLKVMAEGVETEAQLGFLRRNHCDYLQGLFLGAPMPVAQAERLLRARFVDPAVFAAHGQGQGLLLLDDEENILNAISRLLRRDGYRIHTATTADQAFDLLATHEIQVIVSDERMPGMSGSVFLSKVKEIYPDTIRLVLSGYTDLATVTEAINRGAIYRFLTKPWNDTDLREQIREAFRSHERQTKRG